MDGSGKGDVVNLLLEWMDPRHVQAHALSDPTDEELQKISASIASSLSALLRANTLLTSQ